VAKMASRVIHCTICNSFAHVNGYCPYGGTNKTLGGDMSKLDNIILECAIKVLDNKEEKLGDYVDPTKRQIKDLIIQVYDEDYKTFKKNLDEL
jgi:hypothetical protein